MPPIAFPLVVQAVQLGSKSRPIHRLVEYQVPSRVHIRSHFLLKLRPLCFETALLVSMPKRKAPSEAVESDPDMDLQGLEVLLKSMFGSCKRHR